MYTYSLVVVHEDIRGAIRTTMNHLRLWDDEHGGVFKVIEVAMLSAQRCIVKVITNQPDQYAERSLNSWMAAERNMGPITGDLVWWCGGRNQ